MKETPLFFLNTIYIFFGPRWINTKSLSHAIQSANMEPHYKTRTIKMIYIPHSQQGRRRQMIEKASIWSRYVALVAFAPYLVLYNCVMGEENKINNKGHRS